jgi:hypothetical protein
VDFYILFEVAHTSKVYKKFKLFYTFTWVFKVIQREQEISERETTLREQEREQERSKKVGTNTGRGQQLSGQLPGKGRLAPLNDMLTEAYKKQWIKVHSKTRSDVIVKYFSEKVNPGIHDKAAKKEGFGNWKEQFLHAKFDLRAKHIQTVELAPKWALRNLHRI